MPVSPVAAPVAAAVLSPSAQTAFDEALVLHRSGNPAAAEPVYRRLLDETPNHAEIRHVLAVARLQQGDARDADAHARQAITDAQQQGLGGLLAKAWNTRGNILAAVGQSDGALESFRAAEKADPSFPDGAFNQGTLLLSLGQIESAIDAFRRVLALVPSHGGAINNLGAALVKAGRPGEAATHYRQALDQPMGPGVDRQVLAVNLASALEMANKLDDAVQVLADVTGDEQSPSSALLLVRGRVARRQGDLAAALSDMAAALADPLSPGDRIEALFNQGLILDQMDRTAEAFDAFRDGNALVAQQPSALQHDGAAYRDSLQHARRWFTPARLETLSRRSQRLDAGENVVFYVGFPRSGTTLMEQVLEAHPRLVTTMETSPLELVHRRLGRSYPDVVDRLDGPAGTRLRAAFFESAEAVVGPLGERIVVDKLPLNITLLGLAQVLFPRARVLVALRDPRDSVLSCFMQNFVPNPAMVNFLDLNKTAETYAQVMGMWMEQRDHLALPTHVYRYEDLVGDFTATVRTVLDFIGVGWDPAVEKYREKALSREISTPSYRDVTAPLFTRAMGRWQRYEDQLAPVLPVLEPFVTAFGYGQADE